VQRAPPLTKKTQNFEGAVEIMEMAPIEAAAAAVGAGSPMAYAVDGSATVASWRRSGGVAEATHGIFHDNFMAARGGACVMAVYNGLGHSGA